MTFEGWVRKRNDGQPVQSLEYEAYALLAETEGGRGVDFVIEATGVPSAVAEGIDFARRGATYLVVGQYTDHGPTMINPHHITKKQLRVLGSWAFSAADQRRS